MKTIAWIAGGVLAATIGSAALAQSTPPTPPANGPTAPRPPAPTPAPTDANARPDDHNEVVPARFRFQMGEMRIEVHCGSNESVKACVDAATTLIERSSTLAQQDDRSHDDRGRDERPSYRR